MVHLGGIRCRSDDCFEVTWRNGIDWGVPDGVSDSVTMVLYETVGVDLEIVQVDTSNDGGIRDLRA